jgi:DNA-binding CsgD family transcriptional regulator
MNKRPPPAYQSFLASNSNIISDDNSKSESSHHMLTDQETQIMCLLMSGLSLAEVAKRLGVDESLVRARIKSILDKAKKAQGLSGDRQT